MMVINFHDTLPSAEVIYCRIARVRISVNNELAVTWEGNCRVLF